MVAPFVNYAGKRVGRLTVVEQIENHPSRGRQWRCSCDCGGSRVVTSGDLNGGQIKSCGCLRRERIGKKTRTPLYDAWRRLREKCLNPNHPAFKWLGGRGISVTTEWVDDFGAFETWAKAAGYKVGYFLVRRDRSKGFNADNCFWSVTRPGGNPVTATNRAVIRSDGRHFRSIADAVRATPGAVSGTITSTCRRRRRSHAGYGWRYADNP